jgi:hypothetical protein
VAATGALARTRGEWVAFAVRTCGKEECESEDVLMLPRGKSGSFISHVFQNPAA